MSSEKYRLSKRFYNPTNWNPYRKSEPNRFQTDCERSVTFIKKDKVAEICLNGPLTIVLGNVWFMKNIDNKSKRKYSSFHTRLAARLLLAFRNLGRKGKKRSLTPKTS